ncbi:uncharacterized protein LOC123213978 [Mangifera indica]|uniref:uncharacterized protein LOC123213978 n=1 Tax=Mangifera indica TaxID=29780 RepID=UPI001CFAE62C|nr:uncharacterized protein LOC123213978 [Mangifera indica]
MAMQTGVSLSKIVILAGAGYTGTVLINNGKLSDLLGKLQELVRGLENSAGHDGDSDLSSDAIAAQIRRIKMEFQQIASTRQITVLNGTSGGNSATSLIIPAATLGALGYGYMWWKGISFSDLMWVTKKSMTAAVSNLTNHLENVTEALSVAKKHLTQRIQALNDKVEKQNEISKDIQKNVKEACDDLFKVEDSLKDLQSMIYGLDGKIDSLGYKQDVTNVGMYYLCSLVDGREGKMPESIQDKFKLGEKARLLLKAPRLKGLKGISDSMYETINDKITDNIDPQRRLLSRITSA